MAETSQIISCVLLPMQNTHLLLPNVSLAEVVDYASPEAVSKGPGWLLGRIIWRGLRLPVLSYDAANGGETGQPDGTRGRIAVLNTLGSGHDRQPFIALMTRSIPRLAKVEAEAMKQTDAPTGPADLMAIELDGQPVMIPNLEFLEGLALQVS